MATTLATMEGEERRDQCRCVDGQVLDHFGNVIAVIGMAGTTVQIRNQKIHTLGQLVRQTATDISQALGFNPYRTASPGQ
jgi:DNA-binding IclR family transcriptional regulator